MSEPSMSIEPITRTQRSALLLALLQTAELPLVDVSKLNGFEKLEALILCSCDLIADAIWAVAHGSREDALRGVDSLMSDLRENILARGGGEPFDITRLHC